MSSFRTYAYPGLGEWARKEMSHSQAIRVSDIIYISGQGGYDRTNASLPPDLAAEIDQAFSNVEHVLRDAGGEGWSQVYRVRTYSTDLKAAEGRIIENFRRYMPDHCPVWTAVGITRLGLDGMRLEIEVEAYDPEGAAGAKGKTA
ncbi:YjgF-like protein [Xylariaceae sp. AK1471]|nr:YjgF-like protein [Xylariaceae sp. AK1471]